MSFDPPTIIARVLTLVIAFTLHEYAHAWTATRFGDYTPMSAGRLTLNPLSHLDPVGTMALGFGWFWLGETCADQSRNNPSQQPCWGHVGLFGGSSN